MRNSQIIKGFGNIAENLDWLVEAVAELNYLVDKKLDRLEALDPELLTEATEAHREYYHKVERSEKDHQIRVRDSNTRMKAEIERHKIELDAWEPPLDEPTDSPAQQLLYRRQRALSELHNEKMRQLRDSYRQEREMLLANHQSANSELEEGVG